MNLVGQLDSVTGQARQNFELLSWEQLNWKPSPEKWSIAQCLEHLIVNNTNYFKSFDAIVNDAYRQTFWQRSSPFTNWFEKKLLEFTAPDPKTKVKAPPSFSPSKTFIYKNIVQRFLDQQEKLLQYFQKLEPLANSKKIIVSSPFSGLVTFKLDTLLLALVNHEQRHINQADKVLHHSQFPKA